MRRLFPWVLRLLAVAVVAAGLALAYACGGDGEPIPTASPTTSPSGGEPSVGSHPAIMAWEPTGEYRAERVGIGLTVLRFSVRSVYMFVFYSLDHSTSGLDVSPGTVALTDDLGQSYDVVSNAVLGSTLGVNAGLLIVEPYKGEGKTLTLTVTDVSTSSSGGAPEEMVPGAWSVTFIENLEPGAVVDYSEGGKIAPDIVSAGELKWAVAGATGGFYKLVVDRGGQQDALHGRVSDGVAQRLTEEEFH
jgi:hypothetical protein